MPSKVGTSISGQMSAKDHCNQRLEAATSESLHLFGKGNLTFIREKSGKSQRIWKTDVCGNHELVKAIKDYHHHPCSIFSLVENRAALSLSPGCSILCICVFIIWLVARAGHMDEANLAP